jgi:Hydrolase of X-linked nucleoside diphosphate N terminal
VRRVGIKLAALAQDGLTCATNEYDVDRYHQLGQLAAWQSPYEPKWCR